MSQDRTLVQIAFYAALIAALGLIPKVDIPFLMGVPITAQSLGVMLAGVMLGPIRGGLAMALFLLLVALGLPLLAGGRGGLGIFYGPTAGYLAGYFLGAVATGFLMKTLKNMPVMPSAAIAAIIGGIGVVYLCGVPVLAMHMKLPLWDVIKMNAVFIPGDLIKVAVAATVAHTVAKGMPSALLSRA
ncbi:biotin transporter BioY [Flexibacterium corallicola]|uniref:biotin transporter BioY n=1 Tax=Flexibacterium corallicola TaxID=3037259 RepID=UPI00286F248D|nr:biotin transporter BioY [Pseudovibrio sp. M1P-2-3]